MAKATVICYKLKRPIIYNRGTIYEKVCDEFLSYYTHMKKEEAQAYVDKLNAEKPEVDTFGKPINWDQIDYFFVDEQEMMN